MNFLVFICDYNYINVYHKSLFNYYLLNTLFVLFTLNFSTSLVISSMRRLSFLKKRHSILQIICLCFLNLAIYFLKYIYPIKMRL